MNRTSLADLAAVLEKLQLPENHVYVIHSSLLKFGLIEGGVKGVVSCLQQVLGPEATILMPAFSFSYGRSRVWDARETKAETGALTEHFRKLPGVRRTIHPFHSLSVMGPKAAQFAACTNLSSFGPGSPFALLYDMEAINIGLGTELDGGATFLHHAEEMARVPYRFYKDFPGEVRDENGKLMDVTYKMFVREIAATHEYDNHWLHVWDDFVSDGLVKCEKLHGAKVFAFDIKPAHDRFVERLTADPFYCAIKRTIETKE